MNTDPFECPSTATWAARREWFESLDENLRGIGSYFVGEQACALSMEVEIVFCAGAWAAVIVLCASVVEATLREVEVGDQGGSAAALIDEIDGNLDLHWLRRQRNALVHARDGRPALTVDDQWSKRAELEAAARRAVRLALETVYMNPGL